MVWSDMFPLQLELGVRVKVSAGSLSENKNPSRLKDERDIHPPWCHLGSATDLQGINGCESLHPFIRGAKQSVAALFRCNGLARIDLLPDFRSLKDFGSLPFRSIDSRATFGVLSRRGLSAGDPRSLAALDAYSSRSPSL